MCLRFSVAFVYLSVFVTSVCVSLFESNPSQQWSNLFGKELLLWKQWWCCGPQFFSACMWGSAACVRKQPSFKVPLVSLYDLHARWSLCGVHVAPRYQALCRSELVKGWPKAVRWGCSLQIIIPLLNTLEGFWSRFKLGIPFPAVTGGLALMLAEYCWQMLLPSEIVTTRLELCSSFIPPAILLCLSPLDYRERRPIHKDSQVKRAYLSFRVVFSCWRLWVVCQTCQRSVLCTCGYTRTRRNMLA